MDGRAFRKYLVHWYARHARTLPWRSKPTPYRVWVSEIMLQQTRVEAVREHFARFMKRFPSLRKLAQADIDDVLEAWSGLGYYRRARNLHAAAKQIFDDHSGRFPDTREEVLALSGVGEYTAGAILSIAFNQPQPIVDGNVERVFARLHRVNQNIKTGPGRKLMWELAREHVQDGATEAHSPSELNQALMELGATVCTPKAPTCPICPVSNHCKAFAADDAQRYPVLPERAAAKERRYLFVAIHDKKGRILLTRRASSDNSSLLPNDMWELPHVEWPKKNRRAPLAKLRARHEIDFKPMPGEVTCKHAIMDYRLTLVARRAMAVSVRMKNARWFTPDDAARAHQSSATRKLLAALDSR